MADKKMRVVALGGCGAMGQHAVQTAYTYGFVDQIVIADRDGQRAKTFAEQCGHKASFAQIDIMDTKSLAELLSGADVVLNTVGPYFRFGMQVLRTAIEAGCHYLDINDDWEPTLEMLTLDDKAQAANVTAIIGMGASPGMSNLLAARAITELDHVEDVYTGWNIETAVSEPPEEGYSLDQLRAPDYQPNAAVVHGVHQLTGKIGIRRNGKFVDARPIQRVRIEYPGLGIGMAWSIGHPEPLTLPRYYPDIKNSLNVFVGSRKTVNHICLLAWLVNLRPVSVRRAAIMIEKDEIKRRAREKDTVEWRYKVPSGEVPLPPIFAVARGTRGGQPASAAATVLSAPSGGMGGATGVPLAVGLSMLANGKITRRGAWAPEAGIDPDTYFDALAPLCEPRMSSATELILVTRSWEPIIPDFLRDGQRKEGDARQI